MSEKLDQLKAEKSAEKVLADCGLLSPPICPFTIAKRHDIEVRPKQSVRPGVSGFLIRIGNAFGIAYAQHIQNEGFIRFTVSHELGHYFLPGHAESLFPHGDGVHESKSGFVSGDRVERQADYFASSLLMPAEQFRKSANLSGCGFAAIEKLSREFNTSITSTAIRYTKFTDDAVAVIVSVGDRIEYCFMSDAIRDFRGLTWIRKGERLPKSTTAGFNLVSSNIEDCVRMEGISVLSDWFDGAPDAEVNEDVVGLGSYGKTLTVLFTDQPLEEEEEED